MDCYWVGAVPNGDLTNMGTVELQGQSVDFDFCGTGQVWHGARRCTKP